MFVTDTHPLVWYSTRHYSMLSRQVLAAFEDAESGKSPIYLPIGVLWETAILLNKRSIRLPDSFGDWANNLSKKSGFRIQNLDVSTISRSVGYSFNKDLFDKVIVATAVELELPLITKDVAITESNLVEVHW